jgi:hypothetical protein
MLSLYTAIARVGAARVVSFRAMTPKYALALCKQKTLRFSGLTAQRGWARLILCRFHDFLHEHSTFLFPDTGRCTANKENKQVHCAWALMARVVCSDHDVLKCFLKLSACGHRR